MSGVSGYERWNLYVGDTKFGSIGNRAYVVKGEDYYLMPLSLVQLSQADRQALIQKSNKLDYLKVSRKEGEQEVELDQVYDGNPKRSTKRPSAKRIFNAFNGIAIALIFGNYKLEYAIMGFNTSELSVFKQNSHF